MSEAQSAETTTAATTDAATQTAATTDATKTADTATTAATTTDAAKAADAAKTTTADTKPVIPEKYEFTAPEGTTLDTEVTGVLSDAMKELAVPQDKAQAFVNKMAPVIAARQAKAMETTLADARAQWGEAAKTDKEIGGEKFDENVAQAKAVFDTFGTPELGKLLVDSGLGDHPEVIRWAHRVSKHISPDAIHTGRKTEGEKDPAAVMYDGK